MLIFLYGPPGSGKSTIGQLLADSLNLPYTDLDEAIETRSGRTIPEIFATQGETGFRRLERELLTHALSGQSGVVALGGGTLLDAGNRARVEQIGPVVCLSAPSSELTTRLEASGTRRPLLAGDMSERLQTLLSNRNAHYASFPVQIDTNRRPAKEIAWEIQVHLGAFHVRGMGQGYDVQVQAGGLASLGVAMQQRGLRGPLALVSDENVNRFYSVGVQNTLQNAGFQTHSITIPAGEQHKTLETVSFLWESFLNSGLERGSTVVALGGGVVGDLAGFAAATYLRGVPWVVLPTSLLAMADASLGGKTGADLHRGKNLIGAFHSPSLVLADPDTLSTLPEAELRSGLAEVVKAGIIADPALFSHCAQGWDVAQANWEEIVRRSMAVKIDVIQSDPYEKGRRAVLNLGHTIGHAVELVSGYQLRHGEAVALGIVAEARLSERLGLANPGLAEGIADALSRINLPMRIPADLDKHSILEAIRVDKKRSGGKVHFSLPVQIGEVITGIQVDDHLVQEVLCTPFSFFTAPI